MNVGLTEILIILVIIVLIFGSGRLPKLMGDLAEGFRSFKAGLKEDRPPDAGDGAAKPSPPMMGEPKQLTQAGEPAGQQKRDMGERL